jgi:hypothetical protein
MSTLITVLAQNYKDYDIYFIHNLGDGTDVFPDSHEEYYVLAKEYGANPQLSAYDAGTKEACRINRSRVYDLTFQNDHNLDSGVWYKFIKTDLWQSYDYVFFMGEGTLLTFGSVITDTLNFCRKNNAHFVCGAQDKRRLPKELFLNLYAKDNPDNKLNVYHDRMTKEVFNIFCRDDAFKKLFDSWGSDFAVTTENHVPNKWGYIRVNCARKRLETLVDFKQEGHVKFHKENSPEWFGCCCNFLASKEFLEKLSKKIEEYNIHDFIGLPFSADALEVIWGFIPLWLGFDKWFFNGIHRVRKNFVNYQREDDQKGMVKYLNSYYRGKISVDYEGDLIKIKKLNKRTGYLKEVLNNSYF